MLLEQHIATMVVLGAEDTHNLEPHSYPSTQVQRVLNHQGRSLLRAVVQQGWTGLAVQSAGKAGTDVWLMVTITRCDATGKELRTDSSGKGWVQGYPE